MALLIASTVTLAEQAEQSYQDNGNGQAQRLDPYQLSTPQEYVFLQQQIHSGEAESAHGQLATIIEQIESVRHRYHEDLLVPLTLAGDAHMVRNEYQSALEHYDRARHVARVSTGLFDPGQLPIVYREANALRRIGDLKSAIQREEYAYEVAKKAFGNYGSQGLPALYRLADFYIYINHYIAARSLYNKAMAIHGILQEDTTPEAIPALEGIAKSHRLTRFPPYYVNASTESAPVAGPTPGLTSADLENQHIAFNDFPAGERALQQIIEIRQLHNADDSEKIIDALLDLADWHLMFDRSNTARTLYTHIYENYAETGPEVARFAEPRQIYYPLPEDPKAPPEGTDQVPREGYVTLGFDVSATGRVRKLKTLESVPDGLMDFRVRRSMRLAVYRPGFVDGLPTNAPDQTFTYRFTYYPKKGTLPPQEPQETQETQEADETQKTPTEAAPIPDNTPAETAQTTDRTLRGSSG